MKFLFATTDDMIDPGFDFTSGRHARDRLVGETDLYAHEYLAAAPYDGLLLSQAAFTRHRAAGKYSLSRSMRFMREGARKFFRYPDTAFPASMVMGDCGAFSYRDHDTPAYSVDETLDFYDGGGFTHGCSVDHLIFDFHVDDRAPSGEARRRQEITLDLAHEFFERAKDLAGQLVPVGVIQGWSPTSLGDAAAALVRMGYRSLALGGMARASIDDLEAALAGIRGALSPPWPDLHVLGFGKVEQSWRLAPLGVTSFDTTSPLLRAFKDARSNYFLADNGRLRSFTAIRLPQAGDARYAMANVTVRQTTQENLIEMEYDCLARLRAYGLFSSGLEDTLSAIMRFTRAIIWDETKDELWNGRRHSQLERMYRESLAARPWDQCRCQSCVDLGPEIMLLRSTNHNKRRGFHNLAVFHQITMANRAGLARPRASVLSDLLVQPH